MITYIVPNVKKAIGYAISMAMYRLNPFKANKKKSFYSQFVVSGDLVFDIGAHLGDRIDSFLACGASSVIALEPNKDLVQRLLKRYKAHKNVIVIGKGVGAKEGQQIFYANAIFPFISTFASGEWRASFEKYLPISKTYNESYEVSITTLDQIIDQYGVPSFIKIDVEGWEYFVLLGLSSKVKALSVEFISFRVEEWQASIHRCTQLGFEKYNWSKKESFKMQNSEWTDAETLLLQLDQIKDQVFGGDIYVSKN